MRIAAQAYTAKCLEELARIAQHGNGAMRQRRAWQRGHDVADVLAEAAAATLE